MRVSVVIPVFNELGTIVELVERVKRVDIEKEIIIVDDASTDGTREVLREIERGGGVKVFYHLVNAGKGAAIRTGFGEVGGDIVIIQDADLEYNPKDYEKLIGLIEEGKADVVYGSRLSGGDSRRVMYYWHYVGNRFITMVSNMFTNLNLTDMETCYKVFRREVIDGMEIEESGFGFEPEITAKVAKGGWRVYEVGISYSGRTYAEGKKIVWRDGLRALWCIVKYNILR